MPVPKNEGPLQPYCQVGDETPGIQLHSSLQKWENTPWAQLPVLAPQPMQMGDMDGDNDAFMFALAVGLDLSQEQDNDPALLAVKGCLQRNPTDPAHKHYAVMQGVLWRIQRGRV